MKIEWIMKQLKGKRLNEATINFTKSMQRTLES